MRVLLSFVLLLSALGSPAGPWVTEEARIRASRLRSNRELAGRDLASLSAGWTEDFLLITSRSSSFAGRDSARQAYETEFEHHADANYVRQPKSVEVFEAWEMAAETGVWSGSWTEPDGAVEIGGSYYAKWHRLGGNWLTRVEVYSPGYCRGSEYCNRWP